jgi:aspartate carbamoyltransferase catalytic subunit
MNTKHLIDLNDCSKEEWESIINLAVDIYDDSHKYAERCKGKILATLFYEPSTRTQMSFQTAMLKLGGSVIGFDNPLNSSVSKGESLVDTIKIVSGYADIIAMRHPVEGSSLASAQYSSCPIINAGDGGHLHPTQTLTDLVTMKKEIGHIDNLTVGLCGDLKHGRTVHSLIKALCHYDNIKFVLISTPELTLPKYFKDYIKQNNCEYKDVLSLEQSISELDVLYMTRIQKERFVSESLYNEQKNVYVLDCQKLENAKPTLKVLHPLPRVDEIAVEVDEDERAVYFKQAKYGVYARMALIVSLLEQTYDKYTLKGITNTKNCRNSRCITNQEKSIQNSFYEVGGVSYCEYCDTANE